MICWLELVHVSLFLDAFYFFVLVWVFICLGFGLECAFLVKGNVTYWEAASLSFMQRCISMWDLLPKETKMMPRIEVKETKTPFKAADWPDGWKMVWRINVMWKAVEIVLSVENC